MSVLALIVVFAVHGPVPAPAPQPFPLLATAPVVPVEDPPPDLNHWTGSVTAGGVITTGNSETRSGNATADAVLRHEKDRWTLGFLWNYADEKNTTSSWTLTDRRTSAKAKYDYFLSKKSYLLAQTSAEADKAADLDLRTTLGVGAGRQFKEEEKLKFAGEAGLTYFSEDYGSQDKQYLAARLAENVDWVVNPTWNLLNTTEVFPSLEDTDDVNVKVDSRAKVTFTKSMFGQLQWVVDWDNTPASGKERTDQRFLVSVGWKF